jgi:hypothetical protein
MIPFNRTRLRAARPVHKPVPPDGRIDEWKVPVPMACHLRMRHKELKENRAPSSRETTDINGPVDSAFSHLMKKERSLEMAKKLKKAFATIYETTEEILPPGNGAFSLDILVAIHFAICSEDAGLLDTESHLDS